MLMGDHLILDVDRLSMPQNIEATRAAEGSGSSESIEGKRDEERLVLEEEEEPLIQTLECRICQEEDHIKNLESPCACSGSLKVYTRKKDQIFFIPITFWMHNYI